MELRQVFIFSLDATKCTGISMAMATMLPFCKYMQRQSDGECAKFYFVQQMTRTKSGFDYKLL